MSKSSHRSEHGIKSFGYNQRNDDGRGLTERGKVLKKAEHA